MKKEKKKLIKKIIFLASEKSRRSTCSFEFSNSIIMDLNHFHHRVQNGQIMNLRENSLNFSQLSQLKDDSKQHGFCSSPTGSVSSDSSTSSSTSQSMKNCMVPDLSDEELAQLSVRQLNLKLQVSLGVPAKCKDTTVSLLC